MNSRKILKIRKNKMSELQKNKIEYMDRSELKDIILEKYYQTKHLFPIEIQNIMIPMIDDIIDNGEDVDFSFFAQGPKKLLDSPEIANNNEASIKRMFLKEEVFIVIRKNGSFSIENSNRCL